MKKKTIIYASPDLEAMEVRVRSVIATSLLGGTENYGVEQGYLGCDGSGDTEGYSDSTGYWE